MRSVVFRGARAGNTSHLLSVALGVLLIAGSLFAQANLGRILGTVTDQTGAVLPGAKVTVIDTERGTNRVLTTDAAGEYNAPTLIPGTYTVRVEANGFKRLERPNILLEVGKELRVDLTPQPGDQTQTVTVTEAIPLVDATSATLGGTLSNAEINDLPLNGRNYQQLLGLRPGVMLQPGGSPWTQSTNNVRPDETVWMVDGVFNANWFDARSIANMGSPFTDMATILPVDAIQEFNVEENPKAEYGWKAGAVVNVGVRSGTNAFHGSAYAFGRTDSLDARGYFNLAPVNGACPLSTNLAACNQQPTQFEQFGAVVGGAIKKDKLFFFGGYEGMRNLVGNGFPVLIPETAPQPGGDPRNSMADAITGLQAAGVPVSPVSLKIFGCNNSAVCTGGFIPAQPNSTAFVSSFPNDNVSDNYVSKIDYNINDKNRINGMVLAGRYHALGEDHAATNAAWGDNVVQDTWTITGNWVYTPNSRLVNEARYGYNRATFFFDPADASVKADGVGYPINTGTGVGGFPTITVFGFDAQAGQLLGSQGGRPLDSAPNPYWDIQDSVSYLAGKHALKFGGEFAHIEGDADAHDQRGHIFFTGGNAFPGSTPLQDFFAGTPGFAGLLVGNPNVALRWTSTAGFVQDDWRITSKLIINMGMRYSYVTPMKEINNQIGNFLPSVGIVQQGNPALGSTVFHADGKDWSPRLGFAYDLNGKGTTVIRGGASVIYTTFPIANFVANPGAANVPGGTNLTTAPTGFCTTAIKAGSPCPQTFGGTINVGSLQVPSGAMNWDGVVFSPTLSCTSDRPCNMAAVDPNLKNPYQVNYNFGVQRTIGSNMSVDIAYVGNLGERLTGLRDINQCIIPATVSCVRPFGAQFPYLQFINQISNDGHSAYNSLQTTLTRRLSHGLSFTAGYTYGHGLDNGSLNRFGVQPQNSTNAGLEYGNSDYDTRHRFTLQSSYSIPGKKGFGQLLDGWKLNGILTLATGQPWVVLDSSDNYSNAVEFTDRWDFFGNPGVFQSSIQSIPYCSGFGITPAGGVDTSGVTCTTTSGVSGLTTQFSSSASQAMAAKCAAVAPDPTTLQTGNVSVANLTGGAATGGCYVKGNSVMVPPKVGTFGTMGRNLFRDPGFKNLDLSLFKNFAFKERLNAQFRLEFFNVFNHPNLANPYGGVVGSNIGDDASNTGHFGCGCGTPDIINGNPILGSGSARVMQLGFKFTF
ncbi:MAG TPA: TonB-dependent receptor [Bryobacteraceae bacterium]|nr:TonB-dependent receptor [Bryobacteraceae bacterium]